MQKTGRRALQPRVVLFSAITAAFIGLGSPFGAPSYAYTDMPLPPLKPAMTAPSALHEVVLIQDGEGQAMEIKGDIEPSMKLDQGLISPLPPKKPSVLTQETPPQDRPERDNTPEAVSENMVEDMSADMPSIGGVGAASGIPVPGHRPLTDGRNGISEADAKTYARVFRLQQEGKWDEADQAIDTLSDFLLRGHVLYQRYMHPAQYQSTFEELRSWLDLYSDHPGADKIYKLALSRVPAGYQDGLKKPDLGRILYGVHQDLREVQSYVPRSYIDPSRNQGTKKLVHNIMAQVRGYLKNGGPTAGLKIIDRPDYRAILTDGEYANLKAEIAMTYMHLGYWDKADALAKESITLSKGKSPLAGWVAGLIAWKNNDYGAAAAYFERAAQYDRVSPWTASAGAYWAARAHMRSGNFEQVGYWLKQAARYQRTFYGLIATRALGNPYEFNWDVPDYTPEMQRQLMAYKGALRALALVQSDQVHLAEEELKYINPGDRSKLRDALLAYAHDTGLPAYQMRFASLFTRPEGGFYDAALYPLAPWTKGRKQGQVDDAILNAFIRQESRFRSGAENNSGATGLMQIMPATANYVMNTDRFAGSGRESLKDPELNMQIGETYIRDLLNQEAVDNDLFSLAIAYNAGPGNLRRWKAERGDIDDPLLFIETIPVAETRAFVERVMTNIWVYRLRLGQPSPSLDAVASGEWPRYDPMDGSGYRYARAAQGEGR